MTVTGPPAGYRSGRPSMDDVPAIYRLVAAHDVAVIGFADLTEDDLRDEFADPGFDPGQDAWLAIGADGVTAGYAWACRKGTSAAVDIDVYVCPDADPGLAEFLLDLVEHRVAEIGRQLGHPTVQAHIGCYRAAVDQAGLLAARGYAVATTFHRMSVPLDDGARAPEVPPGVTVQVCGSDERLQRAAHEVKEAAFVGHFGSVPQTFEHWHAQHASRSTTDWSQVWLAELDGAPAGMLLGSNAFVPTDNAGYVATLAVHPRARGRGLAKLLLRTAFAEMHRRGRVSAVLGVDTNNATGALPLYESVGMRPTIEIDVWCKAIELG